MQGLVRYSDAFRDREQIGRKRQVRYRQQRVDDDVGEVPLLEPSCAFAYVPRQENSDTKLGHRDDGDRGFAREVSRRRCEDH